jgi:Family of unknown function (DUF6529)
MPSLLALNASEEAPVQARPMHTMSSESDTATRSERNGASTPLVIAAAIGAAVSVSLGVYGRVHDPTGEQIAHFGFASTLSMKAWLGTGSPSLRWPRRARWRGCGVASRASGGHRGGPRICTAGRVPRRPPELRARPHVGASDGRGGASRIALTVRSRSSGDRASVS